MAAASQDGSARIVDEPLWRSTPEKLGFTNNERRRLGRLLVLERGLVLVAGPSGNGLTTTLYSALRWTQTLRPAEPGVVLVGEIRGREAMGLAVNVSSLSQLVLSTIQARDAASSVTRLLELGWDRAALRKTLRGVIAQRLLRRVCASCSVEVPFAQLSGEQRRLLGTRKVKSVLAARGCPECGGAGYNGRLVVPEIAYITPVVECAIGRRATTEEIASLCRLSGMKSLREAALDRVALHQTTLQEVVRTLGAPSAEDDANTTYADTSVLTASPTLMRRATDHSRLNVIVQEPVRTSQGMRSAHRR